MRRDVLREIRAQLDALTAVVDEAIREQDRREDETDRYQTRGLRAVKDTGGAAS